MKGLRHLSLALGLALAWTASAAQGLPPLKDNKRVRSEFLSAAIGDEIRKNCPSISARDSRVRSQTLKLINYALGLGYTWTDINRMRRDPAAIAELEALRDRYLAQNGVRRGDTASYCRLGMAEIAKNSLTGWLLRAN